MPNHFKITVDAKSIQEITVGTKLIQEITSGNGTGIVFNKRLVSTGSYKPTYDHIGSPLKQVGHLGWLDDTA